MSSSPLAEELAALFTALQRRVSGPAPPLADEASECQVCPLCKLIRLVGGVRPETVEHLTAAVNELITAVRSAAAGVHRPDPGPDPGPVAHPGPVQHVDVGE